MSTTLEKVSSPVGSGVAQVGENRPADPIKALPEEAKALLAQVQVPYKGIGDRRREDGTITTMSHPEQVARTRVQLAQNYDSLRRAGLPEKKNMQFLERWVSRLSGKQEDPSHN